jgi:dienelactone hydrolase
MIEARKQILAVVAGTSALLMPPLVAPPAVAPPPVLRPPVLAVPASAYRSSPRVGATVGRDGAYAVGTTNLRVVEPSGAQPGSSRVLPTSVWYPAVRAGTHLVPDRAYAPYPLLAFSTGYDISVRAYQALLSGWASAGFVVAAPTYPHNDPSDPAEVDENDIINHPADLRAVITALLTAARRRTSVLSGLVDPGEIGVVGHSDGAEVTLAVADDSCCRDWRVKAVAVLAGAELASFGGRYFTGPRVPLLVVQGSADKINPPACSTEIYDEASRPKYYLDLLGAGHEPPFAGPLVAPGQRSVVARVTTDFFDAELAGEAGGLPAMTTDGDVPGTARVTSGVSAPSAPGDCPGD